MNLRLTLSVQCTPLHRTAVVRKTGVGFSAEAGASLFATISTPAPIPNQSLNQRMEKTAGNKAVVDF